MELHSTPSSAPVNPPALAIHTTISMQPEAPIIKGIPSSTATPDWKKKKKPIAELEPSQLLRDLPLWLCEDYHASGVLVYASSPDGIVFLLCFEKRERDERASWNAFGGKRERDECSPAQTTAREFEEETGGVFGLEFQQKLTEKLANPKCPKIWLREGKYCLFIVEMDYVEDTVMMVSKFKEMKLSKETPELKNDEKEDKEKLKSLSTAPSAAKDTCPAQQVKWVSAPSFYLSLGKTYTGAYSGVPERFEFTPFFKQTLRTQGVIGLLNRICKISAPSSSFASPSSPERVISTEASSLPIPLNLTPSRPSPRHGHGGRGRMVSSSESSTAASDSLGRGGRGRMASSTDNSPTMLDTSLATARGGPRGGRGKGSLRLSKESAPLLASPPSTSSLDMSALPALVPPRGRGAGHGSGARGRGRRDSEPVSLADAKPALASGPVNITP